MKNYVSKSLEITKLGKKRIEELIEIPKDNENGDFAFPCYVLAKEMKKNPNEIAKEIAGKISRSVEMKEFEKVEAIGPYVNFFIDIKKNSKKIFEKINREKDNYGKGKKKKKVVIEICSPNSNKPLHLGHSRNIILGQSISNICKFAGNEVKIVVVNNDRGIHICKSMVAYEKYGKNKTPEESGRKSDHFIGDYYIKYSKEVEKNKDLDNQAKECLKKWEKGDKKTLELWEKMNNWAFKGFKETYKYFDLKFDKEYFESEFYKKGKKIVLESLKKGISKKKDDGAIFVDMGKNGFGEKILIRKDGTSIYITQDLYLAKKRFEDFKFDKMIYVVASEQDYHFNVLFELLKKFGYKWADKLFHLNYGLVHLESGRMKSREGTVVDIDDLISDLKKISIKEIEKRHTDLHADEISDRAFAISMSALRYYFLKIDHIKNTTFKPEDSISFEGDTGPYLLYSYARALSILKKAKKEKKKKFSIENVNNFEKKLINLLEIFPEIAKNAYENLAPNLVANYTFSIAQAFSEFYHNCPVIGSEEEQFRLKLVDSFSQVMKNALHLLGIPVIREM